MSELKPCPMGTKAKLFQPPDTNDCWVRAESGWQGPVGVTHEEAIDAWNTRPDGWQDIAKPAEEYHEDMGPVVWWVFPMEEPAYIGSPLDTEWPGYHTHWTPHPPLPQPPEKG